MQKNRVVVTGLGIISPVGNDVSTFWQALKEGKSGVGPLTTFDAAKFVQYAIAAAKQAINASGLDLEAGDKERFGVVIGSGIGSLYT
ncbi:MAG: beta-ketoacyl synthase N-terminal-like domain-containing protein, partial [Candidatus Omnitrophota bacterium]